MSDTTTPTPPGAEPPPPSDVKPVSITEELSRSYLDYAMSVIVARALPDARDGLKPVHRRILHSMNENGYEWNKPYRKSARVVGDVIGKYHPHGDQSIYDALVRMAQDFSMRLMLIDGQGNFGSVDGDPPAAMRYTECRLAKVAHAILEDIDKDTVDFQDNYDNSEREPTVLPARFPNLLVNGAGGIAVGMATNIPPHNLGEVIDACVALLEKPDLSLDELIAMVPGPDFPTGGIILGKAGIREAYRAGRGSILVRGRVAIETTKQREALIITEIPFQVNKTTMIEKIAELVRDERIVGISAVRDESDRDGMRVVCELKREAIADVVLNQLYRFTPLQSSFPANMVALTGGRPATMTLHDLLSAFVAFREEVVGRRTKYLLKKARERAHVLVGLAIAVANIDEVIKLIRAAKDANAARDALMGRDWPAKDMKPLVELIDDPRHKISPKGTYKLSDEQAKAILDLRLQRLTALGRDEIGGELDGLGKEISDYLDILRSRDRIRKIVKDELVAIKKEFGTPRRTEISEGAAGDVDEEDLIQPEEMVVTVSHAGYVKRVPLSSYRAQKRGGKGRAGMQTREEDFVTRLFVASTHDEVLFFSSMGKAYSLKVWRLPLAAPQARGKAIVNLLPLKAEEHITSIITLPEGSQGAREVQHHVRHHRRHRAAQRAHRFRRCAPLGHHRHEAGEGRCHCRRRSLHRERRRAALDRRRPMHPLSGRRRARVHRPQFHRRARHPAREERHHDLHGHHPPHGRDQRGTRGVSEAGQRGAPRRRAGEGSRRRGEGEGDRTLAEALCRDGRGRRVHPHAHRARLRQAHLVLRVPDHRPRRQRHRRHENLEEDRPRRRLVPGRGNRPDHAGHRRRTDDPLPGQRHPHRRPLDPGRDRVLHRRGREGGLGRAHRRGRRRATAADRGPDPCVTSPCALIASSVAGISRVRCAIDSILSIPETVPFPLPPRMPLSSHWGRRRSIEFVLEERMKYRTTTRVLMSDKAIARMLIHVTASTVGTILISVLVVAAAVRYGGVDPSWKSYALALVLPAILTPVFSIAYVRANYRLHRLQRELKKLANADPLTDLLNRRAFFERAGDIFATLETEVAAGRGDDDRPRLLQEDQRQIRSCRGRLGDSDGFTSDRQDGDFFARQS